MGANGAKRPWTISNGTSTTTLSAYDPVGRVMASSQTTQTTQGAPQAYSFGYTYNLAGAMTSETYPSGRVITTGDDAANRAACLQGALGSDTTNYVGGPSSSNWIQYTPHGVPWNFTRKNGLTYTADYNARLQRVQAYESLGNANTAAAMLLLSCPQWGSGGPASQPVKICPASTQGSNNGNLAGYLEFLGGPGNAASPFVATEPTFHLTSVNYDNVNRLTGISDSGGWSRSFVYDQWGNMAVSGASGTGTLNLNTPQGNIATISSLYNASNQLVMSGVGYDLAGNMNALNTFSGVKYDAENRLTNESSPGPFVYQYDGSGRRVTKTGGGNTKVYLYDAAGELAAEYDTTAQAALCATCYLSTDRLGSVRLVTDGSGHVVSRHDYLPFGEEITGGYAGRTAALGFGGSEGVTQRFTGKERGSESGLDYFGARYYGSALGRFTSPDWSARAEPVPYADFSNPQTLNQYSYVLNNPLAKPDLDGNVVGVDDAVEGAIIVGVGATIAVSAYLAQPENQRSVAAAVNTAVLQIGSAIDSIFHTDKAAPPPPPAQGQKQQGSKTAEEMAQELKGQIGKNSVPFETPNTKGRINLAGKGHFDKATGEVIPTPHVQEGKKNIGPNGEVNISDKTTRPATKQDVRTAKKLAGN